MRIAWKRDWTLIVLLFLFMRLVYSLLGALEAGGPAPEPLSSGPIFEAADAQLQPGNFSRLFVNVWMRWDTGWFLKIASLGYSAADGTASYQPLFPLLTRLLTFLTGNMLFSALLIANLAALGVMILLYEVTLREGRSPQAAVTSVFWLAFTPTAFFLFAAYTDSLFLFLVLSAWLAARNRRWVLAGLLAGLAALCRLQGVLLTPVFIWMWLSTQAGGSPQPGAQLRQVWSLFASRLGRRSLIEALRKPAWLHCLLPAAALSAWMLFLELSRLGTIPGNLTGHWGIRVVPPWQGFWLFLVRLFTTRRVFVDYVDLLAVTSVLVILVIASRRLDPALSLYAWLSLGLFFMRGTPPHLLDSFSRYMLSVFPIFIPLGEWKSRWVRVPAWSLSIALQVFLVMGFLDWRWVA